MPCMHNFCGACISSWCDTRPRHERITATFSLNHTRDAGSSSPVARPALNAATPSRCTSLHTLRTRTVVPRLVVARGHDAERSAVPCISPFGECVVHACAGRRWLGTISSARSSTPTFGVNLICSAGAPIENALACVRARAGVIVSTAGLRAASRTAQIWTSTTCSQMSRCSAKTVNGIPQRCRRAPPRQCELVLEPV